jgi:hypothetical protein
MATAVGAAYVADRIGLTISPAAVLLASLIATASTFFKLRPLSTWGAAQVGEIAGLGAIVAGVTGWLVWLSSPDFVPIGSGADLAHHLQLVDYIERNWRLIHDPRVEAYLGEMVHYTPGAHLLAALAGKWSGTNGFQTIHPVTALSVGLKAGFVFLIVRRMLPERIPATLAAAGVILLLLPATYFLGSFTRYSYFAQVVSELFAVAAWWALVVWGAQPWRGAMVLFSVAGSAAFLTWPVWIGPPMLAQAAVVMTRRDLPGGDRIAHLLIGAVPIAVIGFVHAFGRLGWVAIVRADADVPLPSLDDFGWTFVLLSTGGVIAAIFRPRGRITAVVAAAIFVQSAVLYAAAKASGAAVPYMAIKMTYLLIYPLAACAALAIGVAWLAAQAVTPGAFLQGRSGAALASILVIVAGWTAIRGVAAQVEVKPIVSRGLYHAGRWTRSTVDPACVDYLVADELTAYWLHLAVLGNPRMSERTGDDGTFRPRDAILRWISPRGLPIAIADLATLPRDVRTEVDELARFGSAVVVKRRGGASCP